MVRKFPTKLVQTGINNTINSTREKTFADFILSTWFCIGSIGLKPIALPVASLKGHAS